MITQDELKKEVTYRDGCLHWKHTKKGRRRTRIGSKCGKYLEACINYKRYQLHHLVWLYHNGVMPTNNVIDHIDRNPYNNNIENLRDVPAAINNRNRGIMSNNTSGYNGVFWYKERNCWKGRVKKQDGTFTTKHFKNIDDAVTWQKETQVLHGYHKDHGVQV